jgi:dihydropyrimidinase
MTTYDILIKNGTIVTATGRFKGDIGIDGTTIKTISASKLSDASKVIDAEGKYILPGVIDPHTHLVSGKPFSENCGPETVSMAIGGVTSAFTFVPSKDTFDGVIPQMVDDISKKSYVNLGIHIIIGSLEQARQIPSYYQKFGVASFKFYIASGKTELYPSVFGVDDGAFYVGLREIAKLGSPVTALVHAENWEVFYVLREELIKENKVEQPHYMDARPNICEVEGISRTLLFAKHLNSRVYIVHVSTGEGPEMIGKARAEGVKVIGETCPHYLSLTRHDKFDHVAKVNPPLREKTDNQLLWDGLINGNISCMGSDHIPNRRKSMATSNVFTTPVAVYPGSGFILPLLLDAVNKERMTLERVVQTTSLNAAEWFGLYPSKGNILPGSDADIVIVDLNKKVQITPEVLQLTSDFSWFDGWSMEGWPSMTIVNGQVVAKNGELVGKPGSAKYLRSGKME